MARREMIALALLFIAIAGVAAEKTAGKHGGHRDKASAPKASHHDNKGHAGHDKKGQEDELQGFPYDAPHKHKPGEPGSTKRKPPSIKLAKRHRKPRHPGATATKGPGATASKPGAKFGVPLTKEGPARPGKRH